MEYGNKLDFINFEGKKRILNKKEVWVLFMYSLISQIKKSSFATSGFRNGDRNNNKYYLLLAENSLLITYNCLFAYTV